MKTHSFLTCIVGSTTDYTEKIKELSLSLKTGSLVFFLGSGVSADKPACMPTGIMLKNKITAEALEVLERQLSRDVYPPYGLDVAKELFDSMMLEKVISHFSYVFGDTALKLVGVLDGKTPNFNHHALASLASFVVNKGYYQQIISLNFDCLLEKALKDIQMPYWTKLPTTCKKREKRDLSFGNKNGKVVIYKPHGSFFLNDQCEFTSNFGRNR
jgi:hypothetical protein